MTEATAEIAERLGVRALLLPMCDLPAPTVVETEDGALACQDYFVRLRCAPKVTGLRFGGEGLPPAPEALAALTMSETDGIIICPSNPLLSITPILATEQLRLALANRKVPAVAVSPLIGGVAVKGPTAKIFDGLGLGADAVAVARRYVGLVDFFVLDETDAALAPEVEELGFKAPIAPTLLQTLDDKVSLQSSASP